MIALLQSIDLDDPRNRLSPEKLQELNIPGAVPHPGITASASEDFATIAQKVPSTFMYLSAGFTDERGAAPAHNPKVLFNEEVLPQGAAWLTHCALRWLEENQ